MTIKTVMETKMATAMEMVTMKTANLTTKTVTKEKEMKAIMLTARIKNRSQIGSYFFDLG